MDNFAWGALALALTLLSGGWAWASYRRGNLARGVRWTGVAALPIAAYLTHTLRLIGRIGTAVGDWAVGFVWNPFVWVGLILAVVGIGLIVVSARLPGGQPAGEAAEVTDPKAVRKKAARKKSSEGADLGLGDDLDDIQAILRKHGIR
jgi:hypothetical protein